MPEPLKKNTASLLIITGREVCLTYSTVIGFNNNPEISFETEVAFFKAGKEQRKLYCFANKKQVLVNGTYPESIAADMLRQSSNVFYRLFLK